MKQILKNLIAEGKTQQTIQQLLEISKNLEDTDLQQHIISQSSFYSKYKQEQLSGTRSVEQEDIALAKINQALLSIIEQLPEGTAITPSKQSTELSKEDTTKTDWWKYVKGLAIIISILVGLAEIFNFISIFPNDNQISFEINNGKPPFFNSMEVIKIKSNFGKSPRSLFIDINGYSSKIAFSHRCNCWNVDLNNFRLTEGDHLIKMSLNKEFLKDEHPIKFKIDNSLPDNEYEITNLNKNGNFLDLEVKGKVSEAVKIKITLPDNSIHENIKIDSEKTGEFYNYIITIDSIPIPNSTELNRMVKDNNYFSISLIDLANNEISDAISAKDFYREFHHRKGYRNGLKLDLNNSYNDPDLPMNNLNTQIITSNQNEPFLKLELVVKSKNSIDLNWELSNYNGEVYYEITKIERNNKDYTTTRITTRTDNIKDSTFNKNRDYEFIVEALDFKTKQTVALSNSESFSSIDLNRNTPSDNNSINNYSIIDIFILIYAIAIVGIVYGLAIRTALRNKQS